VSTAPTLTRRILDALLEEWLPHAKGRRLLLVYGQFADAATDFVTTGTIRVRVHVQDQHSVLGITEAWQDHLVRHADEPDVLVVTTTVEDGQLGWDLRAYAIARSTRTVDRARIVAQRFGSVDVDPRIRAESWLVDALLDAEPAQGWPRNGSVLTRDSAIRALIAVRLGGGTVQEGSLDAAALLSWSRDPAGPARFAALAEPERQGLARWLTDAVGPVAAVVMRLAAEGLAGDVMPLGVLGAVVGEPEVTPESLLAIGGLSGGIAQSTLGALVDAVSATLWRWVRSGSEPASARVLDVLRRADQLATDTGLTAALSGSRLLPSAFTARLHVLAAALARLDDPAGLAGAEQALDEIRAHCLARVSPHRVRPAEMAVRLRRWLATPLEHPATVAAAVAGHAASLAWVDWAQTVLWKGDADTDPIVDRAYRAVCEAVQSRRQTTDEVFAHRLVGWARTASDFAPGGCLLVEQVLATIAVPLAATVPPLVVVLDGMSGAVAAELGDQLAGGAWFEVSPVPTRGGAVAAMPSVTRVSRASLLTGTLTTGGQAEEKDGFAAFWRRHQLDATLFHRAEIAGPAGHRLADPVLTALSDDGVVGVALSTIDYALDHGREGDRTAWSVSDIAYLPKLLDAALGYARPVLLVADHGHILDRFPDTGPTVAPGAESARWRTGTPEPGEVALTGPRVRGGDGTVVVPWREDIRYTQRRFGYHGGAALAEMSVPLLVLLPSVEQLPSGWHVLSPGSVTPPWWEPTSALTLPAALVTERPAAGRKRRPVAPEGMAPLFVEQPVPKQTVGARVIETEVYEAQRAFVPRAPDKQVVAAVIDALVDANGLLLLSEVAVVAGRVARRPEFFAATLQRLLNVDQYPVLSLVDGDRRVRLDVETLRSQFGVRDR
jgi:hypothetical protein